MGSELCRSVKIWWKEYAGTCKHPGSWAFGLTEQRVPAKKLKDSEARVI